MTYVFDAQLNLHEQTFTSFVTLRSICNHAHQKTCPKNFKHSYQVAIDHLFQIGFLYRFVSIYMVGKYYFWWAH